jgi:WD40 repeat protein/serine/threonine protein kinase
MMMVDNLKGKSIRGYRLDELIGVGGFGVVYRAYQAVIDREVAIKVILPEYANHPAFVRNFEREAQLVARLEHPHIVPLYDYWRDPTGAYIVMRFIRGGSLQEALKKGAWDIQATARVLEQIGAALAEAHRNSVVHQDIKAANILLDEQGNAYLTDFGIAKDLTRVKEDDDEHQGGGAKQEVHGSPEYMAPEQILNLPVDARTDIYSLGIVTYEMLTGEKPFIASDDEELVRKQLYERIPSLQTRRSDLSPMFDIVIQRATDKNPKKRYPNPIAMAENFRQFVTVVTNPAPVEAPAVSPPPLEVEAEPEPVNPYKGLRAFQEGDAADFFGREKLVERLYLRLLEPGADARFLAVVGPSGSGKSSVVRAGLVPMIRKNLPKWFITDMIPGDKPLAQLVEAVLKVATDSTLPYEHIIRSDRNGLNLAVQQALGVGKSQLVLVIDQFEEIFTQVSDEAERQCFIDQILTAVNAEDSRLRVIVTLRADFYDRPLAYSGLSELMSRRMDVVSPLTPEELERAIVKPAERVGLKLEAGLVGAIIADTNHQAGALPLLQYALMEMFERREDKKGMLTVRAYQSSGGAAGAMIRSAEEAFASLDDENKRIAEQFFLRLITLGEGTEDTRRRVLRTETGEMKVDQERLNHIIKVFGEKRLLAFDHDPATRIPTIEIAHEALIRNWQRLKGWLDNNREALRLQRQVAEAAAQWEESKRDRSFLAGGGRLTHLEMLFSMPTIVLRPVEREFLEASIQQRTRNLQRVRAIVTGLVIFSIFTALLAAFAFDQRTRAEQARAEAERNSRISRSRELAITALTGTDGLDKALLLGVEAFTAADTFEARDALLTKIQSSPLLERFLQGNTDAVRAVAYSPDGKRIATGGRDNTIRIWDAETAQPTGAVMNHPDDVNTIAFSPDGLYIASGCVDGQVRIWESATGEMISEIPLIEDVVVWSIAYSPDGKTIAAAEDDGTIQLVDVAAARQHDSPLVGHEGAVYVVTYSPDGSLIASGGVDNTIRLWDAATGESVGDPLEGHSNWVWTLDFSPDGAVLASGGFDNTVRLWDVATRSELGQALTGHTGIVRSVAFGQEGRLLVSGGEDRRLILWNIASREAAAVLSADGKVWGAAFNPDESRLVSAADTNVVQVWNLRQSFTVARSYTGQNQGIAAIAVDADSVIAIGNDIANAENVNNAVKWAVGAAEPEQVTAFAEDTSRLATVLVLSSDKRIVVSADQAGQLWFHDVASGELIGDPLQVSESAIFALALDESGELMAVGDEEGNVILLNQTQGVWQVRGQPLTGHIDRVLALAFSPDGKYLASGGRDSVVRLWDVEKQTALGGDLIGHTQPVISLAFSPDGALVASGGRDNLIVLWDTTQQTIRQTLSGHVNWVNTLAFSADKRYLASGSRDGTVILWDIGDPTIRRTGEPFQLRSSVQSVAFSPDSRLLAFGGENGAVQLWQVDVGVWKRQACAIANRNLTTTEWVVYLHDMAYRPTCES